MMSLDNGMQRQAKKNTSKKFSKFILRTLMFKFNRLVIDDIDVCNIK